MDWHFVNVVNRGYPEYAYPPAVPEYVYPSAGSTPWRVPYPPPHYQQNQPAASSQDQASSKSPDPIVISETDEPRYGYLVKVIDRSKRGSESYKMHKLRVSKKFTACVEVKAQLMDSLKTHVPETVNFDIGYIEPSRQGARGKMRWIFDSEDIADMYIAYESAKKSEVILWCEGRKTECQIGQSCPSKRPASEDDLAPRKKSSRTTATEKNGEKLKEVESIYDDLDKRHHGEMSVEQLRVWAHLVSMGKHKSLEEAPDKPFFRGRKKSNKTSSKSIEPPTNTLGSSDSGVGVSPMRRSSLRSQYLQQLRDWHSLYEIGATTKEEYEEQKQTILEDLKKL